MKNRKRTIRKLLQTIWISSGILFTFWLFYSYQSQGIDKSTLAKSDRFTIENNKDFYLFSPAKKFKNVFIFYPGAMVDPKAYLPLCRKIAENNIKVYLIKMPWRLATNGYNKPKELNLLKDRNKNYILSGHSQGAKMATQFVFENPDLIDKLILIGTTHPRDISLTNIKIPILKIYGSNDGVADEKSILSNKSKLPPTTKFIRIEGANHSQFGYYGFQLGDNKAKISRRQQQELTLNFILQFINK